jgi:orotate phosphoribosyltransferase
METEAILKECGALLEGHFLLSSGRHSNRYFQCARLLQYPQKAEKALSPLAGRIAADMRAGKIRVDALAGPALGGVIVAYELGRLLGLPAFFTERDDAGVMTLRRGFEVYEGMNILIAEDVVTTGKSFRESITVLEERGGRVSALACVVDRRAEGIAVDLPFYAACAVKAENWEAGECPLCRTGSAAVKPGSRKMPS